MNILLADDHQIVRMGLCALLTKMYPSAIVFEVGNSEGAFEVFKKEKIDFMLTDLQMPNTDSRQMIQYALSINTKMRILIFSVKPELLFARRFLKAGAHGFVEKGASVDVINNAIRTVWEGNVYLSPILAAQFAKLVIQGGVGENPFEQLTDREFEIVQRLLAGLRPSDICQELNIQPSTVTTYKKRIFEKLGVKNVHELSILKEEYGEPTK